VIPPSEEKKLDPVLQDGLQMLVDKGEPIELGKKGPLRNLKKQTERTHYGERKPRRRGRSAPWRASISW